MNGSGTVNLRIQPFRLLTRRQAAHYLARSEKSFESECAIAPIVMPKGDKLWDVRDLDAFVDGLKAGSTDDDKVVELLRGQRDTRPR